MNSLELQPTPQDLSGLRIIAEVYKHKRATAIKQAAGELAISNVSVYALNDPSDAALFAESMHQDEVQNGSRTTVNGVPRQPRTTAEILDEVVEPRKKGGYKGVVMIVPRGFALSALWDRVADLTTQRP